MSASEISLSLADTVERVRSGVFNIVFLDNAGKQLGSDSAFTAANHFITNGHVFDAPSKTARVWIRREEHTSPQQGIVLSVLDFRSRRVFASPEDEYDYAVLKIDELLALSPHQFRLTGHSKARIGQNVCFLGYPLSHSNLTCHAGILSSIYTRKNVYVLQIDASVNPGNSGGPLIDPISGNVIGIITRKATGLTSAFQGFRDSIIKNIDQIENAMRGMDMVIGGISHKKVLLVGQNQLMNLANELERSANVGIGYAFSSCHLLEDPQAADLNFENH